MWLPCHQCLNQLHNPLSMIFFLLLDTNGMTLKMGLILSSICYQSHAAYQRCGLRQVNLSETQHPLSSNGDHDDFLEKSL